MTWFNPKIYNRENLTKEARSEMDYWCKTVVNNVLNAKFNFCEDGTGSETFDKMRSEIVDNFCQYLILQIAHTFNDNIVASIEADNHDKDVEEVENPTSYIDLVDDILMECGEYDDVFVQLDEGAKMPNRAHTADAGYDLYTPNDVTIKAGSSAVIDTGVHIAIPEGYFGKLESKSGLNVNHSVVSLGGVIDSGYTGSIKVKIYNMDDTEPIEFKAGQKIVQLIIQPCLLTQLTPTDKLNGNTERGDNGFGSTGQ